MDDYSKGEFLEFKIDYDDIIPEDTNFIFIPTDEKLNKEDLECFDYDIQIGLINNGWYQHCNLQQRKILDEYRMKKKSSHPYFKSNFY